MVKQQHCHVYLHSVKSVRIRSYYGPYFPAFGLNNSEYGLFLRSVSQLLHIYQTCIAKSSHMEYDFVLFCQN